MSIGESILELYWLGDHSIHHWNISVVGIALKDADHHISACINTHIPSPEEQRLKFRLSKIDPESVTKETQNSRIQCSSAHLKTIEIYARIFLHWLPVSIKELPEFEPGKTYQIKILNKNNILMAIVVEKLPAIKTQQP